MSELKRCPFCGDEVEIRRTGLYHWRYAIYHRTKTECILDTTGMVVPHEHDEAIRLWNKRSADSPQGDSVSRQYLLAEIDDLADEFSEVDENGLHGERWCGISDAKCVIANAPSVEDRPQGEWIYGEHNVAMCDGYRCNRCDFFVPWDYEHKFIDFINDYHFCPNCGCRMKGADDE